MECGGKFGPATYITSHVVLQDFLNMDASEFL